MAGHGAREHAALVDHLLVLGVLTRPDVITAFQAVPRHLFLPDLPTDEVYRDEAIPTKMVAGRAVSSSSQPAMMALMLEQLNVSPGQRVLEIGAGTGYNAALLGYLVGPGGSVVSVDIDEDIVAAAQDHLTAARSANVQVVCADGGNGYPQCAPYDRIILTVGAWDVAPAWYDQLKPGGRLVVPLRVANGPQESVAFDKGASGAEPRFISRSARDCGFMTLRGAFAGPEVVTSLGPMAGLTLTTPGEPPADSERIYGWLSTEPVRHASGLRTTDVEASGSLCQWVSLHVPALAELTIEDEQVRLGRWPCLYRFSARAQIGSTIGLLTPESMALLDRPRPTASADHDHETGQAQFELDVVGYGPQGDSAAQALIDILAAWHASGRPATARMRLRLYSPDADYAPAPGEVMVRKRWTKLVVDWPALPIVDI